MNNKQQLTLKIFFYIILSFFMLNALYFANEVHSTIIRADQWRFIELYLYPIENHTFNLSLLWSDHHPNPVTAILFICSAKCFDLTLNLYFIVGIVSKILFISYFVYLVDKSIKHKVMLFRYLGIVVIVSAFLSLKSINEYAWPLVTLSNIWLLSYLVFLVYFHNAFMKVNKIKIIEYVKVVVVLSIFLIFSKDLSLIFIGAFSLAVVLIFLYEKKYKHLAFILISLFISYMVYKIFYFFITNNIANSARLLIDFNNVSIVGVLESFAVSLLSGLFNIGFLKSLAINNTKIVSLGYIVLFLYLTIMFIYIKNKLYQVSIIPFVLMLFTLFFTLAVILFRYPPVNGEVNFMITAPRYTKLYEVGIIAMFWIFIIIIDEKTTNEISKWSLMLLLISIFLYNLYSIKTSWQLSRYIVSTNKKLEQQLSMYIKNRKISNIISGSSFSEDKVKYLKKKGYSVFSKDYHDFK